MATVVIGGVPRGGKSLLAHAVYNSIKCSVVHLDMVCGCVRKAYPSSFPNRDNPDEIYGLIDDFQDMLIRIIKNIGHEFNDIRVFESTFLNPKEVSERLNKPHYICIYFGYPNVEPEEKLSQLRTYGKSYPQCWTNKVSDTKLIEHLSHFIEVSKTQKK
ncbi:hypothetical protein D1BOALGB6SA_4309 [Olavius sp. associated proteobacterium Delta 1]|nr:hypothetical protein D1BOALGB6SA_4309 [Olavius sp. associated proteobacterium Delta 1]